MAVKLIKERYENFSYQEDVLNREYICDTDADFADLPKGNPGDTAVSVATGNIKVVNASGNWVDFGGN